LPILKEDLDPANVLHLPLLLPPPATFGVGGGLYNTAGFNDDTRAFPSIPARHDVWRRASANWLAGLVVRGIVGLDDAEEMAHDMAYGLAKKAYKL